MPRIARELGRLLFGGRARRRWVHLILGGALAMPYFFVGAILVGVFSQVPSVSTSLPLQLAGLLAGLPLAAVGGLLSLTRPMSVAAVRTMCGVRAEALAEGPQHNWAARRRTSVWFTLHLTLGSVVSALTLALPPLAAGLLLLPFVPALRNAPGPLAPVVGGSPAALTPLAGLVLLFALAALAAGCGALLARVAPALLGPTPADRLARAERRAAELAVRNRLARELHDSVGHALSAVTLQASAARRVLDRDPGFVREALAAIEETGRRTVGELDTVLGVLRETDEADGRSPAPTLAAELDGLLARTRAAGLEVRADTAPRDLLGRLPAPVSREGYRIVQEALSNALRHGAGSPVDLQLALSDGQLLVEAENQVGPGTERAARRGGGHGLPGVGDRVRLLGGTAEWGPRDGRWHLSVRLPVGGGYAPSAGKDPR